MTDAEIIEAIWGWERTSAMRGTMRIFKTDGTIEYVDLIEPPPLDLLQKSVGGYIEAVPYWDTLAYGDDDKDQQDCVAYCNEEGKLNGLPLNEEASIEWHACLMRQGLAPSDVLVGDVVVITGDRQLMKSL